MIEHRGGIEQNLEDQDGDRRRPQRCDYTELDGHRQHELDRMKPHARGHVKVQIGMMHPVHAPEDG
jgi:hypothetical protein